MAVKARGEITLTSIVDIASTTRYYKLQSSTLAKPAKPTVNPPSGWVTTEPTYTAGATNSLYTCDITVFSDGTWSYSDVSLSSSYEAAKDAYNKAVGAAKTATDYMDFGTDGLTIGDMTSGALAGNVRIDSDGVEIRNGSSVLARLKAGVLELAANSVNAIIKLCGGKGTIAYYADTNQLAIMSPGSIAMTACQTLPDGTVQPWDAGIACNRYGAVLKGVVELSGSLRVLGREGTLSDWVVAEGTSGIWRWRKWASGDAECYMRVSQTFSTTIPWGPLYYDGSKPGGWALPFTFDAKPNVSVTLLNGSVFAFKNDDDTTTNVGTLWVISAISYNSLAVSIEVKVDGRWKQ